MKTKQIDWNLVGAELLEALKLAEKYVKHYKVKIWGGKHEKANAAHAKVLGVIARAKKLPWDRDRFTAEEIEIMWDILCNTSQDKFRGSFPLMLSICGKIGGLWSRNNG